MKKLTKFFSAVLGGVMAVSALPFTAACGKKNRDSIVIMTEELSGLFNPFYATAGADMDVVGMTQISMLSSDLIGEGEEKEIEIVAGDEYASVVKDYEYKIVGEGENKKTIYQFVLKNGLKFSDGKPLTMHDVLFNMYVYLDPVYTGSSTMYSIDIDGLDAYRYQQEVSEDGTTDTGESLANNAASYASNRIRELRYLYETVGKIPGSTSYKATEEEMKTAINGLNKFSSGFQKAVGEGKTIEEYRAILLADYELTLKTFKEELEADFKAAKESFDLTTEPYKEHAKLLKNDIFKFFLYEGYITPEYLEVQGKKDRTKIVDFNGKELVNSYKTQKDAINKIYNDKVVDELNGVLTYWGTAGTLATTYAAEATDILLHANANTDGSLKYKNIRGIVSLGHTGTEAEVTFTDAKKGERKYTVAREHNEDGTPKNANEYDVLQITVNGTDPKALMSFGFSVAPAHYYSADETHKDGRKVKGATIHWVDAETAVDAEVRQYENLFQAVNPDTSSMEALVKDMNPNSLEVLTGCKVEASLANAKAPASYQFMRLGYFCPDSRDCAPGHLVFNRSVSLKDSFKPGK